MAFRRRLAFQNRGFYESYQSADLRNDLCAKPFVSRPVFFLIGSAIDLSDCNDRGARFVPKKVSVRGGRVGRLFVFYE